MKPLLSSLLALLTLAACSTFGGDGDPPWDTDIPESEAFNAGAGEWGPNGHRVVFPHSEPSTDSIVLFPSVSQDGQQIAFSHRPHGGGGAEFYLMNADGTGIRQVTQGPGIARRPEWHPDGQTILFTRFRPNVSRRAYLLDVETLAVTPVFPAKPFE